MPAFLFYKSLGNNQCGYLASRSLPDRSAFLLTRQPWAPRKESTTVPTADAGPCRSNRLAESGNVFQHLFQRDFLATTTPWDVCGRQFLSSVRFEGCSNACSNNLSEIRRLGVGSIRQFYGSTVDPHCDFTWFRLLLNTDSQSAQQLRSC